MAVNDASIEIVEVKTRRQLRAFIDVQDKIHANDAHWIRPLIFERMEHYNPAKNVFLSNMRYRFWLALRQGDPIGRIGAQINPAHLDRYRDATGQFGSFDCINDQTAADALLNTAENWLAEQSITRITGPFSHSINEESGLLVDGYNEPPVMMMGHNLDHYDHLLTSHGYRKAQNLFCYRFSIETPPNSRLRRIMRRIEHNGQCRIRMMDMKRYQAEIDLICDIFNDAWQDNWGFIPFGRDEARYIAASLRPLIHRGSVIIAELDGNAVGMIVGLPNINEAARDLQGKLLPFGWAKLLWRLKAKKLKSWRVPLMGVRRSLRSSLLSGAIALAMVERLRQSGLHAGIEWAELSWILEGNRQMRKIIETLGAERYKTYRVYEKQIR